MAGIYFHIPFCRKKCSYCDFHFSTTFKDYRSAMLEQIGREFQERTSEIQEPLESIYLGGGTPSLLNPEELAKLLESPLSFGSDSLEITIEVNPEDLTRENLVAWEAIGINRLSIGVQTLNPQLLEWMNRNHTAQDTTQGLELLREHAFSLSIDLIFGVPKQSEADLLDLLALIDQYQVEHVSAYALTQEPQTLLHHRVSRGTEAALNDEQQVKHYHLLEQALSDRGFEHYEVSNYAKPGKRAIHNGNYWKGKSYLGIGPGAHSFDGKNNRRWNVSNNAQYLKQKQWYEQEHLNTHNQWNEMWLTGLRTLLGVPTTRITELGGPQGEEEALIETLINEDKLNHHMGFYTLNKAHWLSADGISMLLFRTE